MKSRATIYASKALLLTLSTWWAVTSSPAASLQHEYRITKWETDDGLPENSATAMVQTPDGYLWFGTFNGLVRFDGVKFTTFNPLNTPELPSAGIVNLHLHKTGRLWISTDKGLASFKDGQWKRHGRNTSWTNRIARTFAANAAGVLCATSFDGAVCRIAGEEIIELPPPTVAKGQRGHVDPAGIIWAVSAQFFGHWDGSRWIRSDAAASVTNAFRSATTARDGALWVLKQSQVLKLEAGRIIKSVELGQPIVDVWTLFEDADGVLWAPSYKSGLFRISQEGAVEKFTMADGLSYDALRFVFQDRERNLWVGSSGGGLMRLRPRTFHTYGTESSLPARVIKSVWEERPGSMLLGTYGGGVAHLDGTGTVSAIPKPGRPATYVQCVLSDHQSRTWIGSYGQSADYERALVMLENGQERQIPPAEAGGISISALFEDSAGRIWIGGNESVARLENGRFQRVSADGNGSISAVRCFAENPADGSIWAVNRAGLFRFAGGRFQATNGPGGKPLDEGNCLRFEGDGTLWVGTRNASLLRLRKQSWTSVDSRAGLPSDTITSVLEDGQGHFWIGSNRGVARVAKAACNAVADGSRAQLDGQVFTVSDGLASVECAAGFQPNATTDSQGRLWFATSKGVAMVDPKQFRLETNPPPLLIESASYVDRNGVQQRADLTGKMLQLPAGSTQLEVNYTALSLSDPQKVRFAHQLIRNGQVLDRTETLRRSARATLLPPGQYSFQVKAANHHGVWSAEPEALSFTILPFYWQTLWFRSLAVLTALAGVGGTVWRVQHNKLRRHQQQLMQERILAEEQGRLASVLEGTTDLVGFASSNGSALYINPAGRRMVGLTVDEDVTRFKISDFHPTSANDLLAQTTIPDAIRNGTWSGEVWLKRRDGSEIPVSQVLVAHKNAEGQLLFFSTIMRDISDQRLAQQALQRSESALRSFMDALPTPALMLDRGGALVAVNEALARSFGRRREELIGRNGYSMLPPDLAAARKAAIDRVFATGQEIHFEDANGGRHYINYLSPVTDADGGVAWVAAFALDITERQRAEENVKESLSLLEGTLESTADGILVADGRGKIVRFNRKFGEMWRLPAEVLAAGNDEVALQIVLTQLNEPEQFLNKVRELYNQPAATSFDLLMFKDGRVFERYSQPQQLGENVVGRVWSFRDVTARKEAEAKRHQLEAQLRQAQKMEAVGTLAGGIAHDFNNILAAIIGNAGLALADTAQSHPTRECLEEIKRAGARAKSLVQQILAFSRQQPQERRVIALGPLIDETVSLLRATLPASVELVTSLESDALLVLADPTQMHQVLVNLCTNAWHAMEDQPGLIEIKLQSVTLDADTVGRLAGLQPGRFACLSVRDTGKGMDADTLKRIFDPFFTTKEPGQGTGLGLSVVHGIVHGHDGAITVTSQPGQGATFQVYLPIVEATVESSPAPTSLSSRGLGQHILYLDDEEPLVLLATRTLERLGYRVTGFTRAADAVQAFRENPGQFALVITDLTMPGTSGLRIAADLLKLRPDVPVVLCSGHVTEELRERARRAGIRDVLYKPNTIEEFSNTIHRLATESRRP